MKYSEEAYLHRKKVDKWLSRVEVVERGVTVNGLNSFLKDDENIPKLIVVKLCKYTSNH